MPRQYTRNPHPYPPKVERTCAQCNGVFFVTPSVVRKGQGKYCSDACRQIVYQSHRKECVCVRCGKTFWRPKSSVGAYCSRACFFPPVEKLLWPKVDKSEPCWLWTGCTNKSGYGLVSTGGHHSQLTHRVAWELVAGPVPDGLFVLHTCDNPACVRNDDEGWYEVNGVLLPRRGHLFLGTRAQNNVDKLTKGRGARGETAGHAKLTDAQVIELRGRYAASGTNAADLAREYGVSKNTVMHIVSRRSWKHLP